ncbi:MAG: DUF2142 domain-containing protein [Actinomycetota bacterium]|nr:DUF2142 domain-containing protein [Actinomycetota bacterium]
MSSPAPARTRRGLRVFLPAFLLLSVLSILWALATPIFASPDESAHAVKAIAQVHGQFVQKSRPDVPYPVYNLPDAYRFSPSTICFAFYPDITAACPTELGSPGGTNWFKDWVSGYNPVYYEAVGWPSLFLGGSAGIYGMRIVSSLLSSALLAGAFVAAMAGRRARWMPAGLTFLAAPMSMFLSGSVNPQAMEFSAGALLTVSLLRLLQGRDEPAAVALGHRTLWILVTLSAAVLAIARATGPLWVVVIVGGVFLVSGVRASLSLVRERSNYPWIATIAAFGVFSVVWTLITGSLSGQAQATDAPLVGGTFVQGFWAMIRATPFFAESAAGIFGWQDTVLPAVAYALVFGALAILFALALSASGRRGRVVLMAALGAAVIVPALVQAASVSRTGIIWQGRYGLFLYLAVILLAAWLLSHDALRVAFLSVPITVIINVLMAVFGVFAFVAALRRYVVGTGATITKMVTAPQWQPPLGWPTLVVLAALTVIAFSVWNARSAMQLARAEDAEAASTSS